MYVETRHSGTRTRLGGIVTTAFVTAVVGYAIVASVNIYYPPPDDRLELVLIEPPPPPPPPEEPEPPKVEIPVEAEVPPPPLVAPEVLVEVEIPEPVIVAPPAPPVVVPDPAPVAPAPSVGSNRTGPKIIAGEKPEYPAAARRAGEQGTTHLEVCVSTAGRVTSVSVAQSSGSSRLDEAAAKWIRGERFKPGTIGGQAQSMCGHDVYYQWNLKDA